MINIEIRTQPDDETCGPTSLHAVYRYYGDKISLKQVIKEVEEVETGGTIAAMLGKHALLRNYKAILYVYNLTIFDPTWFKEDKKPVNLIKKIREQMKYETAKKFLEASQAYIDFLQLGGKILFKDLTVNLLKQYFEQQTPILTGLSATYLYESARVRNHKKGELIYDDVRGEPCGHFVILCGYDEKGRRIIVSDPHRNNHISNENHYKVKVSRLINSIMLGVLTYDANLLIIEPK